GPFALQRRGADRPRWQCRRKVPQGLPATSGNRGGPSARKRVSRVRAPVGACKRSLVSARACENHVYVVSSTYTEPSANWMVSAIFGHDGKQLATAKEWGEVAGAEGAVERG